MFVGRVMIKALVTVSPATSMVEARDIIAEKQIGHLLVVDKNNNLLGIVSDRDIKKAWASPATTLSSHELNYLLSKVTVDQIMSKNPTHVSPSNTVERAALIMTENRLSALPVMDEKKLVGIITRTDVMRVLLEAIGIGGGSYRFIVLISDQIGSVEAVTVILKQENINILSLVTWPEKGHPGVFQLIIRVAAGQKDRAIAALRENGFSVLEKYVEDHAPYLPKK